MSSSTIQMSGEAERSETMIGPMEKVYLGSQVVTLWDNVGQETCFHNVQHFHNVYFLILVLVDTKQTLLKHKWILQLTNVLIPLVSSRNDNTPDFSHTSCSPSFCLPPKCLSLIVLSGLLCARVCPTEATEDKDTLQMHPHHQPWRYIYEQVQKPRPPLFAALINWSNHR